jgi:CBS-domain-containing membrane protein
MEGNVMVQPYIPLSYGALTGRAGYRRPASLSQRVTLESPAVAVMTDLDRVMAVTIGANVAIATANQCMIAAGVRLLLVADEEQRVLGLITASDILGEKPLKHMQRTGETFDELAVSDLMTPREALEVLQLRDVGRSRVGDIVATLKYFGRQHALVVETLGEQTSQRVRGIFSATQIGRQLGMSVAPGEVATTFAQLETVLMS